MCRGTKKTDLNQHEAYLAMFEFLENFYERTKSDDVAVLLSSMSLLEDGQPADSAIWGDWLRCISIVKQGHTDTAVLKFVDDEQKD